MRGSVRGTHVFCPIAAGHAFVDHGSITIIETLRFTFDGPANIVYQFVATTVAASQDDWDCRNKGEESEVVHVIGLGDRINTGG